MKGLRIQNSTLAGGLSSGKITEIHSLLAACGGEGGEAFGGL